MTLLLLQKQCLHRKERHPEGSGNRAKALRFDKGLPTLIPHQRTNVSTWLLAEPCHGLTDSLGLALQERVTHDPIPLQHFSGLDTSPNSHYKRETWKRRCVYITIKWSGDAIPVVKYEKLSLPGVDEDSLVTLASPPDHVSCCDHLGPSWGNDCLLFTDSQRGVCLNTNFCPWAPQSQFKHGMGKSVIQ